MSIVSMAPMPPFHIGSGAVDGVTAAAVRLSTSRCVMIVLDRFWQGTPVFTRLTQSLADAELAVCTYADFHGEPKSPDIEAIAAIGRTSGADLIIGLGGGAALDAAKIASCCIPGQADPEFYGFGLNPLPPVVLPTILIPTTAGTGSEANSTAIFTARDRKKSWIYGQALTTRLAVLDPDLTASLPPPVAAACGMDALVHAFESATNANANAITRMASLDALRLICGALRLSVNEPDNVAARQAMLLGSFYAGYGISNAGTAVAHNVSHALAALHPVAHGHATALAFEQSLPWVLGSNDVGVDEAAAACGTDRSGLVSFIAQLMDDVGLERQLPNAFTAAGEAMLLEQMNAPENHPMRDATLPPLTQEAMADIAWRVLELAKVRTRA
ncbi:MAG: iron-containing alcohol dehydrogenase [Ahrensia sp.]